MADEGITIETATGRKTVGTETAIWNPQSRDDARTQQEKTPMSGRKYHVDFDGERVASDVGAGWFDDTPRTIALGQGVVGHHGHVELGTNEDGVDFFLWTDNTNTRPGREQNANVVTRRLLDEDGNHTGTGHWSVYPTSASVA